MNATPGQRFDRADGNQPYRPATAARDPREVVITPGWNVRDMTSPETREWISLLKLSILERGVDKAISVKYDIKTGIRTLVDGQCRLQACKELWQEGHKIYVPMIEVKGDEAELLTESLASNSGLPLTQLEIGKGCWKLIDKFHWTVEQVSAHIGKRPRYVTEAITLAQAPAEARELITEGKVTPGAVLHALKENNGNPEAAVQLLEEAVASHQPLPEPEPEPPQPDLPGLPAKTRKAKKPKPLARPKKKSAKEALANAVPRNVLTLLKLADKLADVVISDDQTSWKKAVAAAKAYKAER